MTSARLAVIVREHMPRSPGGHPVRLAVVAALALEASTLPSDAVEERLSLRYGGYWRALRILTLETQSVTADAAYRLEVTIRTEGLVGLLYPWQSRTQSVGGVRDGLLVPRHVRTEGTFRSQEYRGTIDYLDSGDLRVAIEPPSALEDYEPVPEELRRATIDPQTATLSLIRRIATGAPCTGVERIFDGRLRYDVQYTDLGTATVERSNGTLYGGPARVCEALVHPVAGLSRDERVRRRWGRSRTTLRYWLAPVLEGMVPVPVRLDLDGARGRLSMYLTDAHTRAP